MPRFQNDAFLHLLFLAPFEEKQYKSDSEDRPWNHTP